MAVVCHPLTPYADNIGMATRWRANWSPNNVPAGKKPADNAPPADLDARQAMALGEESVAAVGHSISSTSTEKFPVSRSAR